MGDQIQEQDQGQDQGPSQNALAALKGSLPTLQDGTGIGFECLEATDLVAQRISIAQPSSQTAVEQGNWYDTNTDEPLGKDLEFFVMSKRTTHFIGKDMQTGEEKEIEKKEMLVMPKSLQFPSIISLSATGYWPMSNILTKLYKSYGQAGYPMFTGLIKATTELVMGDKGKYFIPKFEFVRHATKEEMEVLIKTYQKVVPSFRAEAVDTSGTPTGASFEEPVAGRTYPDPVAAALDITQEELDKAGTIMDPADVPFGDVKL